jgi:hypothetical protein
MSVKKVVSGLATRSYVPYVARGQATAAGAAETAPVRPYEEIPGPKPLPVLGNGWRFLPGIGIIFM